MVTLRLGESADLVREAQRVGEVREVEKLLEPRNTVALQQLPGGDLTPELRDLRLGRPGRIAAADIAAVIGIAPLPRDAGAPRAPGMLEVHYAPRRPLRLVSREELRQAVSGAGGEPAVLAFGAAPAEARARLWLCASADPLRYARELYANLRRLDDTEAAAILVERPPRAPAWDAVADRLERAARR